MKINPTLLSISYAAVAAVLWTGDSVSVFASSVAAMNLSGDLVYLDSSKFGWQQMFVQFSVNSTNLSGIAELTEYPITEFYNF